MTQEVGSRAEAELAIERLVSKFEGWLIQQPEVLLIWMQPRDTRKRIAAALADALVKIPVRDGSGVIPRDARRAMLRELNREEKEWWKGIRL